MSSLVTGITTPAEDMATMFRSQTTGLSMFENREIYIEEEPASIDETVTIITTGGSSNSGLRFDEVRIQIRVKSKTFDNCRNIIYNMRGIINGRDPIEINGSSYQGFYESLYPLKMRQRDSRLHVFVNNYRITFRPNDIHDNRLRYF